MSWFGDRYTTVASVDRPIALQGDAVSKIVMEQTTITVSKDTHLALKRLVEAEDYKSQHAFIAEKVLEEADKGDDMVITTGIRMALEQVAEGGNQ